MSTECWGPSNSTRGSGKSSHFGLIIVGLKFRQIVNRTDVNPHFLHSRGRHVRPPRRKWVTLVTVPDNDEAEICDK